MAREQDERGLKPKLQMQQAENFLYLFVSVWALTIYLPLRTGSGKEHCGLRGVLGLIFPCFFFLCVPDLSVLWVWPAFFAGLMIHRLGHFRAYWRGDRVHTQYGGYPWLALRFRRDGNEIKAKTITEPLLVAAIGGMLLCIMPGLGLYYLFGAGAMFGKQLLDNFAFQRQLDQFHDALIENQYLMSHTRGVRRTI